MLLEPIYARILEAYKVLSIGPVVGLSSEAQQALQKSSYHIQMSTFEVIRGASWRDLSCKRSRHSSDLEGPYINTYDDYTHTIVYMGRLFVGPSGLCYCKCSAQSKQLLKGP